MAPCKAKLIITHGGTVGREFLINKPKVLIGRWDNNENIKPDIDLSDEDLEQTVSRRHAYIYFKNEAFYWEDCNANNLSYINRNQALAANVPHPLENGSELILGNLFFRFFIDS